MASPLTTDPKLNKLFPSSKKGAYISQREADASDGRMEMDSEIKRLEDRIEAVNREGQLRLDAVMARIEGKFETIAEQNRNMESSLAAIRQDVSGTRSTIKNTALASVLAIAGIVFAGIALWGGGFSSGQADRPPAISSPNTPTH